LYGFALSHANRRPWRLAALFVIPPAGRREAPLEGTCLKYGGLRQSKRCCPAARVLRFPVLEYPQTIQPFLMDLQAV
jgi:hypothetical protein